jgi:hypothetical protein
MLESAVLFVRDQRRRGWGKAAVPKVKAAKSPRAARQQAAQSARRAASSASRPEGWSARLKQQAHSLARAVELLEQAATMAREPRSYAVSRAQSLRASALIAMVASAELLVAAGWYEADDAVAAGSVDRE